MSFFNGIESAPDDPILSLGIKCAADERDFKVNLGIGAYNTAEGNPLVLSSVRKAESRILEKKLDKSYLQIDGNAEFRTTLLKLNYGKHCSAIAERRIATLQTIGGSGALRVAGEFIAKFISNTIYISDPAWANHKPCFLAAGLKVESYTYYDRTSHSLDFEGMISSLKEIPSGSAVLLQASCHNPTGLDPTFEQWEEICDLMKERELFPLFDCAYQGFGEGLKGDTDVIRLFIEKGHHFMMATSCSKNFGLYGERVGMLSAVCSNKEEAECVSSQCKKLIRINYSNPPINGARIVAEILTSSDLRTEWMEEVSNMRERIQEMRKSLISLLMAKGSPIDFTFLYKQQGMFSYTGLSSKQVDGLREDFGIYMPQSGRINVAGLNSNNLDHVAKAMVEVARQYEKDPV